ncbi:hypothetical protein OR214_03149 [Ralstonia pickettii OR214]|jgi:hypothetical protein|uniref:Uncharacterized protein n=1 Tax=Ralstonia pickettii OR214 TaxID=1264675 RepID=R0CJI2_RALPI|nr:hypothetical protein OR214_03149 [Ralstonia pickettii OR214]
MEDNESLVPTECTANNSPEIAAPREPATVMARYPYGAMPYDGLQAVQPTPED